MYGNYGLKTWCRIEYGFLFIFILLLVAGCDFSAKEMRPPPTNTPVASIMKVPQGVQMARDATLTYVGDNLDASLPSTDADWTAEFITLGDIIGTNAYRLSANGCVVVISYPLVTPDSTIYHIVLDDSAAGFYWEGDVDSQGQVFPQLSSMDDTAVSISNTINLVTLADLHSTVGIEVCKLDCASYTPIFTIGNPELIAALVAALDTDILLRPHARCPAVYHLRFILANGKHHDFGYTCEMITPTFIRGNQDFWGGQDGIAPDAFNELMLSLIAPEDGKIANKKRPPRP